MSPPKKKNGKNEPWFDVDPETGKFIPLPMNWNNGTPAGNFAAKKSSEKKPKRTVELKPLHLTFGGFKEPEAKVRKIESHSVRKGLFTQGRRGSLNTRNSTSRRNLSNKKAQINEKINMAELSPLMNMEEVEEELLNKKASLRGYPFKSPSKPALNFSRNLLKFETKPKKFNIPQVIVEEPVQSSSQIEAEEAENIKLEPKTPDSASSNEFLKMEEICSSKGVMDVCTDSPISSMCNLLSGTGLGSSIKPKMKGSNIVTNIKNIIHSEEIAFNQYRIVHETNMKKLFHILSSFEKLEPDPKTPDKENNQNKNNRRSVRLQKKSSPETNSDKLLVSPSILRSGDLRKSTLKKNFSARNQDLNTHSPRTRKAFALYNTFREKHSILETPKLDRRTLMAESPSMGRYISMKVQNQCLLLQDTPVHK